MAAVVLYFAKVTGGVIACDGRLLKIFYYCVVSYSQAGRPVKHPFFMLKVVAIQIADGIDVKQFRSVFPGEVHHADSEELFYVIEPQKLLYVFKYGIVCFLGYNEVEMLAFIQVISPYCRILFDQRLSEEFDVETGAAENKFGYTKMEIVRPDVETLRLIMLNVSQSVALDHFNQQTNTLLEETNAYTLLL